MRFILVVVMIVAWSVLLRAQVCVDTTTIAVEVSTADYVAPLSTTTTKAVLLQKLYGSLYETERSRRLWLEALARLLALQDEYERLGIRAKTLWDVAVSTR